MKNQIVCLEEWQHHHGIKRVKQSLILLVNAVGYLKLNLLEISKLKIYKLSIELICISGNVLMEKEYMAINVNIIFNLIY